MRWVATPLFAGSLIVPKYNLKMNNAVRQTYSGRFCLDAFASKARRYLITDLNGSRTWSDLRRGIPRNADRAAKGTENACVLVAGATSLWPSPGTSPQSTGGYFLQPTAVTCPPGNLAPENCSVDFRC